MSRVLRITDANTRKIGNAVFDNWTSGVPNNWTATGSPTTAQTISEGTIQTFASAYALNIQNASTQAVRGYYQDITDVNDGQTYYLSVYVKPLTGNVRLYAWDGGGTSNAVFVESSGTEWQQLIVEKTAVSTGIRIGLIAFDAGSQAVFDLVQLATFNIEFIEGVYSSFFRVTNWEVQVPDYKGSGVFSSSPVAEGRKLIDGYWDNVTQTITFHLRGDGDTDITTQNAAAEKLSELFNALQAARDFSKTSWVRDPVYMQYKAENETNYRYAFIANARIPQLSDQYNIEFAQLVMLDLDLIIEHPVAFGMPPGEGAPVLSGVRTTYNSQDYGNYDDSGVAEDTAEWVHMSSRHNLSNITNMHQGTGGANQMGGSLPRVVVTSGGTVYFGVDTSVSDAGPFANIIFHISRAAAGTTTGNWQFYNGSSWITADAGFIYDSSVGFTKTGWCWVTILMPWVASSPGGGLPTGYWIRFTSTGSYSITPQIDREIFAVGRNYLEFDLSAVNGNISSIAGFVMQNSTANTSERARIWRIISGLRSVERGEDFQSIINLGNEQNHSGITIGYQSGSGITKAADNSEYSTGYVSRLASSTEYYTEITIASPLSAQYTGEFRCFLVAQKTQNAIVAARMSYQQSSGENFVVNEATSIGNLLSSAYAHYPLLWDLGLMIVDTNSTSGVYNPENIKIRIYVDSSNSSNFDLHSFVMIPVDEFAMDTEPGSNYQGGINSTSYFKTIDQNIGRFGSVMFPKAMHRTHFYTFASWTSENVQRKFVSKSNGPMVLQQGAKQRFYTIALNLLVGPPDVYTLLPSSLLSVRPLINPRYLGMRGSN